MVTKLECYVIKYENVKENMNMWKKKIHYLCRFEWTAYVTNSSIL